MVHRIWNKTERQSNENASRCIKLSNYETSVKQLQNRINTKLKRKQVIHHEYGLMSHYLKKINRISQQI